MSTEKKPQEENDFEALESQKTPADLSVEELEKLYQQLIPQQIDALEGVEELEPVPEDDEEQLDDGEEDRQFDDYNEGYKVEGQTAYVDEEKGEVVDRSDLTPWEMIESLASQLGVKLLDPKDNCKDCHGRGYTGIHCDTKTPIPCMCIFPPEAKEKQKEMAAQAGFMNRRAKRRLAHVLRKERQRWLKKDLLSRDKDRQLQIKARKKKRDKIARASRRTNRQKVKRH